MSYAGNKEFTDYSPSNREFAEISRQITAQGGFSPVKSNYYDDSRSYQDAQYSNNYSYQPITREYNCMVTL